MDLEIPDQLDELATYLAGQPLLALALGALLVTMIGGLLRGPLPFLGGFVKGVGNLGLVAALLLTIAQFARLNTGFDFALPQVGIERQSVEGRETRVAMAPDGHFWIRASINGVERDFLVDTGATLTALAPVTAQAAQIEPSPVPRRIAMRTANGTVPAELVTVDELRFGNIVARDLDAVVAPGLGEQNVIGMNLLSRLASWRVEGRTLILVPNHPQSVEEV
ncbi:retropepsin-like aspartic protease family protein [Novosphingobium mangrovi (ex Hu et al. 2023)]|uniref:TIGR02281 family clan AA aspartic protease n=1 Tax=Novosphingobium mangrovi (ex Hu et al. 2023) TaxID=2930094 RepID=A0ABT0AA85_9SPHN|nr:TIGR02281 family clan AA aspartic protease [Novosphingobium mangrovi (ex Hu et al. 2023)]MCJ1960059.1 TIGR02281 family clan AA aspartic protease [Novosphingobium mangrovi (ex Hu et al. 2023)]